MVFDKIKLWVDESITQEKNIQIRERMERKIERYLRLLLAILLAGNFISALKSVYSVFIMALVMFMALLLYIFFDLIYLDRYSLYTDKLITNSR